MTTISALIEWNTFKNNQMQYTRVTVHIPDNVPITRDAILSYGHRELIQKKNLNKDDDYMHERIADYYYMD